MTAINPEDLELCVDCDDEFCEVCNPEPAYCFDCDGTVCHCDNDYDSFKESLLEE